MGILFSGTNRKTHKIGLVHNVSVCVIIFYPFFFSYTKKHYFKFAETPIKESLWYNIHNDNQNL